MGTLLSLAAGRVTSGFLNPKIDFQRDPCLFPLHVDDHNTPHAKLEMILQSADSKQVVGCFIVRVSTTLSQQSLTSMECTRSPTHLGLFQNTENE